MTYKPDTLCVHHAPRMQADHSYGAIAIPIYQTASYAHPGVGQSTGYDYVRESNPTRRELEQTVNALENAFDTVATSSGMAALSIALELLETKTHVICSRTALCGRSR